MKIDLCAVSMYTISAGSVIATVVMSTLRFAGVIDWSWWLCLSPVLAVAAVVIIFFALLGFVFVDNFPDHRR